MGEENHNLLRFFHILPNSVVQSSHYDFTIWRTIEVLGRQIDKVISLFFNWKQNENASSWRPA